MQTYVFEDVEQRPGPIHKRLKLPFDLRLNALDHSHLGSF